MMRKKKIQWIAVIAILIVTASTISINPVVASNSPSITVEKDVENEDYDKLPLL